MSNTKKTSKESDVNFENSLKMMQYFQEEFQVRSKHYWDILIKMLIFDMLIIALPIMSEAMGFSLADIGKYKFILPGIGLFIAVLTYIILEDEAKKIAAVNKAKYEINELLPTQYRYRNCKDDKNEKYEKKNQMAHKLPKYVLAMETIMCALVFGILCLD